MLLLVDINPHIERRISGGEFPKGRTSFSDRVEISAKGYGADLARLSASLHEETALMVMLGSSGGELYTKDFLTSPISLYSQSLRDSSQELICLEEKYKETKIFTKEPRMTREDILDFYQLFKGKLAQSDLVVLTENTRKESPDKLEEDLIKLSRASSVPIVLGFSEKMDYRAVIDARPFAMLIDRRHLEKIYSKEMNFMGELTDKLKEIFQNKLPFVLLTGSSKGAILYSDNKIYYGHPPKGEEIELDSSKALLGMALGIARKYGPEMILRMAIATGNKKRQETDLATIKAEMNKIVIETMEA